MDRLMPINDFMKDFRSKMIDSGLARGYGMIGCWDFQIRKMEKYFDIKFPPMYRDFLKLMGRGAGKFLACENAFYPELFANREALEFHLKDVKSDFVLKKSHFVFLNHAGYIFGFFDTEEGDDPPTYGFDEDEKLVKVTESFSSGLIFLLEETIDNHNK